MVVPKGLVTSGPYALVRHPIYTSYLLLFGGACLFLGSWQAAIAIGAVCLLYYRARCHLEEELLTSAFPMEHQDYRSKVPWLFLPGLL